MRLALIPSGSIILPPLPAWPDVSTYRVQPGVSAFQAQLLRQSAGIQFGAAKDASYLIVPMSVLSAAIAWTLRALAAQGVGYVGESFDCEDFVNELDSTLRKMAARANLKAAPLTCCLTVLQQYEWARVPAGGVHAVAAVQTDGGVVVVESQNGATIPLESYPNRGGIRAADNF